MTSELQTEILACLRWIANRYEKVYPIYLTEQEKEWVARTKKVLAEFDQPSSLENIDLNTKDLC